MVNSSWRANRRDTIPFLSLSFWILFLKRSFLSFRCRVYSFVSFSYRLGWHRPLTIVSLRQPNWRSCGRRKKKSCSLNYLFFSFFFLADLPSQRGRREIVTDATVINRGSSIYYLSPVFSYQYQRPLLVVVFGKEKGKGGIRSHGTNRTWTSWQRKNNKKKPRTFYLHCVCRVSAFFFSATYWIRYASLGGELAQNRLWK